MTVEKAVCTQEAERQHSAGVDELHIQLQLEHEKLSRATERLNEIDQSTCDVSKVVEENIQQAKDIDALNQDICDLKAANDVLQSDIKASTGAHASVKLEVCHAWNTHAAAYLFNSIKQGLS